MITDFEYIFSLSILTHSCDICRFLNALLKMKHEKKGGLIVKVTL